MRKCCSSTFGINPANWENNQGSKNVSLGCQGPLFSLWCPSSAPQEVLPSGEEALTFQPRLTRPEHPTGLMRHSCLSVFFVDQLFSCISLLGKIEGSTFLSTVPKITLSLCPGGVGEMGTEAKGTPFLSSHHDTATRTWGLGCFSQSKPRLLWGNAGALKS